MSFLIKKIYLQAIELFFYDVVNKYFNEAINNKLK